MLPKNQAYFNLHSQPDGQMPSDKAAGDDSFATFFSEVSGC